MQALVDEIDPSLDTDPDVLAPERELEKTTAQAGG